MRVGGIGNDPVVEDSGDDDSVTDTSDTAAADGSDPFTSGASRSRDSGSSSGTSSTAAADSRDPFTAGESMVRESDRPDPIEVDDGVTDTSGTAAADPRDPFTAGESQVRESDRPDPLDVRGDIPDDLRSDLVADIDSRTIAHVGEDDLQFERRGDRIRATVDDDVIRREQFEALDGMAPSPGAEPTTRAERVRGRIDARRDDDPSVSGIGSTDEERRRAIEEDDTTRIWGDWQPGDVGTEETGSFVDDAGPEMIDVPGGGSVPAQTPGTPGLTQSEFEERTFIEMTGGEDGPFGDGISPGASMSLQDPAAVDARAEKEQEILGWRDVDGVSDIPRASIGGLFGLGQRIESGGVEAGETISGTVPSAEWGPQAGQETVGEIPANLLGGSVAFGGMALGAAGQLPGSALADVETHRQAAQFDPEEGDTMPETPTQVEGGSAELRENFAQTQVDMVTDYPMSTFAGIALPMTPRAVRGAEQGAGAAGVTTPPRPTIQRMELGDTSGVTLGTTRQRGRVEETSPGLSVVRDPVDGTRIETGTPEVSLDGIFGERGSISGEMTAAETNVFTESLRGAGRTDEAQIVESYRGVQTETQHSTLRPDRAEDVVGEVLESQGVPQDAAGPLTDLLASQDAQLYGSTVQRASAEAVGEPGVARTPRDIDVGGLDSSLDFARQAEQRINRPFDEPVVQREGTTVRSRETGEELFDLHEAGEMAPEGSSSLFGRQRDRFGVREDPTVTTREGVETTTLPEQTRRKGMGATEVITRESGEVGPVDSMIRPVYEGRLKDIPDFYVGERANIEALRQQGRPDAARRAEGELDSFVDAFGDEMATRARSEYDSAVAGDIDGPRTQLADFADIGDTGLFAGDGLGPGTTTGVFGASGSPSPSVAGSGGGSSPFGSPVDPSVDPSTVIETADSPSPRSGRPARQDSPSPAGRTEADSPSPGLAEGIAGASSVFPAVWDDGGAASSAPVDTSDGIGGGYSIFGTPQESGTPVSPPPGVPDDSPGPVSPPTHIERPYSPFAPIETDSPVASSPPIAPSDPFSPVSMPPVIEPRPSSPPTRRRGDDSPEFLRLYPDEEFAPETPEYTNPIAGVFDSINFADGEDLGPFA